VIHVPSRWRSKWARHGGQLLLSRRTFLLASGFAAGLAGQKPEVSSFDFSLLDEGATPADLFFVREHFPAPSVSAAGWKLSITGEVAAPVDIPLEQLVTHSQRVLPVTIECAENPPAGGLVSHAEWGGASLGSLLERARPRADARFVRFSGADGFSRTVPLAKAIHPDTLIGHQMNGEKLPVKHGFPLRAIVPGWYGMTAIKWLRAIEVLAEEPREDGYMRRVRSLLTGTRTDGPVTAMNIKSEFSRPLDGAILTGRRFIIRGAAWAGENRVGQVEVSVDSGKSWQAAKLLSTPQRYSWVHWSYPWTIKSAGAYELSVRTTDDQGRRQPDQRASDRADEYEWNGREIIRVNVT
jgi:DMSO/TMAO reductase YedYZ molybdopterin-dependent catalytic subunit